MPRRGRRRGRRSGSGRGAPRRPRARRRNRLGRDRGSGSRRRARRAASRPSACRPADPGASGKAARPPSAPAGGCRPEEGGARHGEGERPDEGSAPSGRDPVVNRDRVQLVQAEQSPDQGECDARGQRDAIWDRSAQAAQAFVLAARAASPSSKRLVREAIDVGDHRVVVVDHPDLADVAVGVDPQLRHPAGAVTGGEIDVPAVGLLSGDPDQSGPDVRIRRPRRHRRARRPPSGRRRRARRGRSPASATNRCRAGRRPAARSRAHSRRRGSPRRSAAGNHARRCRPSGRGRPLTPPRLRSTARAPGRAATVAPPRNDSAARAIPMITTTTRHRQSESEAGHECRARRRGRRTRRHHDPAIETTPSRRGRSQRPATRFDRRTGPVVGGHEDRDRQVGEAPRPPNRTETANAIRMIIGSMSK